MKIQQLANDPKQSFFFRCEICISKIHSGEKITSVTVLLESRWIPVMNIKSTTLPSIQVCSIWQFEKSMRVKHCVHLLSFLLLFPCSRFWLLSLLFGFQRHLWQTDPVKRIRTIADTKTLEYIIMTMKTQPYVRTIYLNITLDIFVLF